jgi:hypothetical protein
MSRFVWLLSIGVLCAALAWAPGTPQIQRSVLDHIGAVAGAQWTSTAGSDHASGGAMHNAPSPEFGMRTGTRNSVARR